MAFERPQKSNPHDLTVNQHTFPVASIARFVGASNGVELFYKPAQKVIPVKPKNQLFCAKRVWNQQAEIGFMRKVEDSFQALAEEILSGQLRRFGTDECTVISRFYCLWNIRSLNKHHPTDDQSIAREGVICLAREYTLDEQEQLEKGGVMTIRPDLTLPGRHMASTNILLNLQTATAEMKDVRWGLLIATEGEFIVPDNHKVLWLVPLTPTISLHGLQSGESNQIMTIDRQAVAELNRLAIEASVEYYFARDLSQCPQ